MSAPTLPELIERIRESGGSLTIELALTEIDRRLTALEERTAPPFSGNEVTANLLRAAEEARAKAAEDGLAMLEKRETGSFGDYPSFQAYLEANKSLAGAMAKHVAGAASEPVTAGQRAAALVMLGPEIREGAYRRERIAGQWAPSEAGAEFMAHVGKGPPLTPRAMFERAHSLVLDGDTDNGAGVWELQEECVREGWETLFEEATQGERGAHALLERVITEAARTISPELRADIDRALDRARGGSST